ncbi:MAG: MMPL family transporter, partial [Desulfatitalea sp.]|nr:MMPL family transporter [Desulfatitalea sp.]
MERKAMSAWLMPLVSRFWLVVLIVGAISVLAAWALPRIAIQNDLSFMLPDDNRAKMNFRVAEERFGNSGGIAIAIMSPEGIYQPDLLQRVRQFTARCRELNIRIPAGELGARWHLSAEQGLALAGLLQSLSADPEFNTRLLAESMATPEGLAEMISDGLPAFLEIEDAERFSRELADQLIALAASRPSLAEELYAFAMRTTDLRGHVRNVWVDQVVALTETDTVWPEFTDHAPIAAAMAPFGFSAGPDLERFTDLLLEAGVTRSDAIQAFPAVRLQKAGLSAEFLAALNRRLTPEAAAVLARTMAAAPKQIRVADLTPREITAEAMEAIQARLRAWSFLEKGIYSQDEKSLLVVVRTAPNLDQPNRAMLLEAIKPEVNRLFGDGRYTIHMAGYGVVDEAVARLMIQDVARLFPLVIGVVILFLFFSFRNLAGVLYPLLTVLMAVAWSIAAMSLLDVPLSAVGTAMPVLLVAVGSAYGIHLVHYFALHHGGTAARRPAVAATLDGTGWGVVLAGLTTVAGFASLASNSLVPLRAFGIFTALGVLFALLVSLVLIPALLLRFGVKAPAPARNPSQSAMLLHRFSRGLLGGLVHFASGHPKTVLLSAAVILAGAAFSFSDVRVEMNNVAFFKDNSEIRQADTFINRHFAGTVDIRMVFSASAENGVIDPAVLATMDSLGRALQARHAQIG